MRKGGIYVCDSGDRIIICAHVLHNLTKTFHGANRQTQLTWISNSRSYLHLQPTTCFTQVQVSQVITLTFLAWRCWCSVMACMTHLPVLFLSGLQDHGCTWSPLQNANVALCCRVCRLSYLPIYHSWFAWNLSSDLKWMTLKRFSFQK